VRWMLSHGLSPYALFFTFRDSPHTADGLPDGKCGKSFRSTPNDYVMIHRPSKATYLPEVSCYMILLLRRLAPARHSLSSNHFTTSGALVRLHSTSPCSTQEACSRLVCVAYLRWSGIVLHAIYLLTSLFQKKGYGKSRGYIQLIAPRAM